jgi:hypothetical protein
MLHIDALLAPHSISLLITALNNIADAAAKDDDDNDERTCLRRCIKLQYIYIVKIFWVSIWNIKKTFCFAIDTVESCAAAFSIIKNLQQHRRGRFCVFKERLVLRSFFKEKWGYQECFGCYVSLHPTARSDIDWCMITQSTCEHTPLRLLRQRKK